MKTLSKNIALLITALLISFNTMAGGFDFENEQYIDDIPFNLEQVEMMTKFNNAVDTDFSFTQEEFINDLHFSENELDAIGSYNQAISHDFDFEDEVYINDIPTSIVQNDAHSTLVSAQ